nr:hypothetical protein [Nostoc sp. 'Peltigera malacea cyanobiont' DB3992]
MVVRLSVIPMRTLFAHIHACGDALSSILSIVLDVGLYKSLQQLSDEFPNSRQSQERFGLWWQTNYSTWAEQLKTTVINYRNINHQWEFSIEQQQVLQRYYDTNQYYSIACIAIVK